MSLNSKVWRKLIDHYPTQFSQIFDQVHCKTLLHLIHACPNREPSELACKILEFAYALSQNSRRFLESNDSSRLPDDYLKYPGKMDHISVGVLFVPDPSPALPHPSASSGFSSISLYSVMTVVFLLGSIYVSFNKFQQSSFFDK